MPITSKGHESIKMYTKGKSMKDPNTALGGILMCPTSLWTFVK